MRDVLSSEKAVMDALEKSKNAMMNAKSAKEIGESVAKNITVIIKVGLALLF